MTRARLVMLGALLLGSAACSQTGLVSGEVSAALPDGRQQRAYRVDVVLVKAEPFRAEWIRLVEEFQRVSERLRITVDRANADIKEYRPLATQGATPTFSRSAQDRADARQRATAAARYQAALDRRRSVAKDLRATVPSFERRALDTIARHRVGGTQTDVIGHFALRDVPLGRYYVFAALPLDDGAGTARWLLGIGVGAGEQTVTLSAANSEWPFAVTIPED
ncbi:MAG TPA: hypothetical protein VGT02_14140 [Methylomirabilota bacterium]|nr:hypothetical protein [Methylomirabilota bacterium]